MGQEAANFTALSQFLEKIERYIIIISRRRDDANQIRWTCQEFVWKQVLDSVYTRYRASYRREDSYRLSFSAITEALIQGKQSIKDTLIEACVREHKGQFTNRRGAAPYRGDIYEIEAPEPPDEDTNVIRQEVRNRMERVFKRLPREQAKLLRLYYLDGPKPSHDELGRLLKIPTRAAVKMRLLRAKKNFSKVYKEAIEDDNDLSSPHYDYATPHSANVPEVVGRERSNI